jgi:hypothetical protein
MLDIAALINLQVKTSLEAKNRHHSQHYVNGTLCDLTGKAREATVQVSDLLDVIFYILVEFSD